MERHKCKLCSRTFANGRALGGHMKAHFSTLPLPPKPEPLPHSTNSLSYSSSSSASEDVAHRESEEKGVIYGLRENPKKSFRLADPEFSFPADTGSSVVQDRESETESKNPITRRRSKRNPNSNENSQLPNKPKLIGLMKSSVSPPVSSVSETWPEEDVAMCLVMLSRDSRYYWRRNNHNNNNNVVVVAEEEEEEVEERSMKGLEEMKKKKLKRTEVRGKNNNKCDKCGKTFRSSRALGSHKSICSHREDNKIFECPFCYKVFGSGQALGGHKRSHLIPSSSSTHANHSTRVKHRSFIDLNLPAPPEEDDLSVVSDA